MEREKMLEDRPRVEQAVIDLAGRRGYDVQRSAEAFAGRKLFLRYRSVLGQNDRVEVDLNYLFRLPLAENETCFLWQPGGLDRPQVRTVAMEELLCGKLLALLDRGAARDFWDTAHLPESAAAVLGSPLFRAMLIALSAILEHPLPSYGRDRLAGLLTDRDVSEHLMPLLASPMTPRSADLFPRAWAVVEPFLSLDTNEKEYIAGIYTPRSNGNSPMSAPIGRGKGGTRKKAHHGAESRRLHRKGGTQLPPLPTHRVSLCGRKAVLPDAETAFPRPDKAVPTPEGAVRQPIAPLSPGRDC
jgi:hypothetical protein